MSTVDSESEIKSLTVRWLEKAVIGLNLCPFAKPVYVQGLIRYSVSVAQTAEDLVADLERELGYLSKTSPNETDTTLLIHPWVLNDFFEYNLFLSRADSVLGRLHLEGVVQIASFHPKYQFAGSDADDIENFTNRSPYPMLHLLREASVARAIAAYGDTDMISSRNQEKLREIGFEGLAELEVFAPLPTLKN